MLRNKKLFQAFKTGLGCQEYILAVSEYLRECKLSDEEYNKVIDVIIQRLTLLKKDIIND